MTDEELRAVYMAGAPGALAWPWPEGLRAVLAAFSAPTPVAQPVAYRHMHEGEWEYYDAPTGNDCAGCAPLYTAPPAAVRVPLTDEQIEQHIGPDEGDREAVAEIVRAVERLHGIAAP